MFTNTFCEEKKPAARRTGPSKIRTDKKRLKRGEKRCKGSRKVDVIAKLSFDGGEAEERKKALFNQVLGNPKREFFGFDNTTEKIINKQFNRFVEKELRKARI